MCTDLKWSMVKLRAAKRGLVEKGLIRIDERQKESGPGQTSNFYRLITPHISNYTPHLELNRGGIPKPDSPPDLELDTAPIPKPDSPPVSKPNNEVLTTEALTNEVLTTEELEREKRVISHLLFNVFKELVECLYPHLDGSGRVFLYCSKDDLKADTELDPVTRDLMIKIYRAAAQIYSSFDTLKRPLPEYRSVGRWFRSTGEICPSSEAQDQIQAYSDYCRLTQTFPTTDPDKLPQKLLQADWCQKLLDWAEDQEKQGKYDAAYDDELNSHWLREHFYSDIIAYCCRRYDNRIVYANEEYLAKRK